PGPPPPAAGRPSPSPASRSSGAASAPSSATTPPPSASATSSRPVGDRPPVVALIGPTAAGKSAIALAVAEAAGAELVAVDAFTVYRGMDIGTAKPTTEDRRRVPHHMVDVLDVEQ